MGCAFPSTAGALTLMVLLACNAGAMPPADSPEVLIIDSYVVGHTWTDEETAGFIDALRQVHPDFAPHVEFMDWKNHPEPENLARLSGLFRYKYAARRLDAVVAMDNAAFDFALAHRAELFPGVPLVFCGINGFSPALLAGHERVTGVAEKMDVIGTLRLMLQLHPRTRQILVATEATEIGAAIRAEIAREAAAAAPGVELRDADARSFDELLAQVGRLPDDSLVLIDALTRDAAGHVFRSELSARSVSEHSRVPVYGLWDFQLGKGIVGGWLLSGREQGELAAGLTLRAIRGEQPAPITDPPSRLMFDYRQLKRFGLKTDAVPAGAEVINAPPGVRVSWRWLAGALLVAATLAAFNLALLRSIRGRRRAEQALREREQRFRALVEHGSDLTATARADRSVDFRSPAFTSVLGHPLAELGQGVEELVHPEDRAGLKAAFDEAERAPQASSRGLVRLRHRDGSWRWVEFVLHNLLDDPAVGRLIINAWDVSQRIEAEAERARAFELEQQMRRQAEAASTAKDEFLAILSHELRTPLTPILGWVQRLRAGKVRPEAMPKAFAVIEQNARAQLTLVEDLIDLSLIVAGQLCLDRRPTDLVLLATEAVDSLEAAAARKRIVVERHLEPVQAPLFADPQRVQQILRNLLSNAVKFTPDGGRIEVSLRESADRFELTVRDTGVGLSPEQLPLIFSRFWQADSTSTRRFGGLGLGLPIVRHLVEAHGGEVRAESPGLGKGTTFTVSLPRTATYRLELGQGEARLH